MKARREHSRIPHSTQHSPLVSRSVYVQSPDDGSLAQQYALWLLRGKPRARKNAKPLTIWSLI